MIRKAPTFADGLLKSVHSFIQGLSFGGHPGKVPSSCSHSSSCRHPRQSVAFWRVTFLQRIIELLAEDSFFCPSPCLVLPGLNRQRDNEVSQLVCRTPCASARALHVHFRTQFLFPSPPLPQLSFLQKLRYMCAVSHCPLLFILRSCG